MIGGLIIVIVTYLSKTDRPILAGLAILFPTITLTSYFLIGYDVGVQEIRNSIPSSLVATVGYFALFPVMYYSSYYFGLYVTIGLSLLSWAVVTIVLMHLFGISPN